MTHYEVLGIKPGASAAEVKSAYRRVVLKHHPDRSSDPRSKQIFLQSTEAYETLSDPERRRIYDYGIDQVEQAKARSAARSQAAAPKRPAATPPPKKPPAPAAPKAPPVSLELARLSLLMNRGQFAEAETLARTILRQDAKQAIPYAVLGDLARSRGQINEAQRMYAYAVQMDPRNAAYQRRYEQLLASSQVAMSGTRMRLESGGQSQAALIVAGVLVSIGALVVAFTAHDPMLPDVGIVSTWSLSLVILLFLSGATVGACLSVGGYVERFEVANTTASGRYGPSVTLAAIAIVNFWAAVALYVGIGMAQRAFTMSTTWLILGSASCLALFSLGALFAGGQLNAGQVLLWGGNVVYLGALLGWLLCDSLRGGAA